MQAVFIIGSNSNKRVRDILRFYNFTFNFFSGGFLLRKTQLTPSDSLIEFRAIIIRAEKIFYPCFVLNSGKAGFGRDDNDSLFDICIFQAINVCKNFILEPLCCFIFKYPDASFAQAFIVECAMLHVKCAI